MRVVLPGGGALSQPLLAARCRAGGGGRHERGQLRAAQAVRAPDGIRHGAALPSQAAASGEV